MLFAGVSPLAFLHVIFGAREGRHRLAIFVIGVPAAVVEVQVSVDDDVDLVGRNAGLLDALQQLRLVLVDGLALFAELVADAGLDQDVLLAGANQQRIKAHGMVLRSSGWMRFSHITLGMMPNMAPPSMR